jgi:hypothetical protein
MKEQIPADHPAAMAIHEHFGLTEEQIQQTTITYDSDGESEGFCINFGENGIANSPQLTNQLLKMAGIRSPNP